MFGTDAVWVTGDRPEAAHGPGTTSSRWRELFVEQRFLIAVVFAMLVVVGAIASLTTGNWWFLPLAVGVHAVGTVLVTGMTFSLLSDRERPSPTAVAMLEEEGIHDPERYFSALVAELSPDGEVGGLHDALALGTNQRTVTTHEGSGDGWSGAADVADADRRAVTSGRSDLRRRSPARDHARTVVPGHRRHRDHGHGGRVQHRPGRRLRVLSARDRRPARTTRVTAGPQ